MNKINIQHEANVYAQGNFNSKHCKPVVCLETGAVYSSATDAAEANGVTLGAMSSHLTGRYKTVRGKHYCYLARVNESLDSIVTRLREASAMEAKAKMWDEMITAQEKARKEEERRLAEIVKAEERRKADIAKAEAVVAKLTEDCAKYEAKWMESMNALNEAEIALEALRGDVDEEAA